MKNTFLNLSGILLVLFIASCESGEKFLSDVSSRYIELNDSRVHYKEYGKGEETLIFVHGWGCDLNTWKYQFDYFKDEYHVVLIDLPGFGKSDTLSKDYTMDLFAESVVAVIHEVEVQDPVLVAHSMGLPVAMEVLKRLKSESAKLINLDGVYFDFPADSIENRQYREMLIGFVDMFTADNYEQIVVQFPMGFITDSTPDDVREYIRSTMTDTPQRVGYQSMRSLTDPKYWDKEPVRNQTLAIYARTADLLPNNEEVLRKQFTHLTYAEMDGVNHFLMMEEPVKVNELLNEFIRN